MNTNKNKNRKIWYHFLLVITPLLQTNSGLIFLIGGFLHDELANHLDSLIDRSVLSVKIQYVATARSKHGHGIHYLDSIWLKIWDHFWLATTSGSIPLFLAFSFLILIHIHVHILTLSSIKKIAQFRNISVLLQIQIYAQEPNPKPQSS